MIAERRQLTNKSRASFFANVFALLFVAGSVAAASFVS
jgi:hypothetical protein